MTSENTIPQHCDVVVIGGGPAGSSAAIFLAKAGLAVVLLEKAKHPRAQVGESLIPHFWKLTDALGVSQKIVDEGFLAKAGGIVVWNGKIQQIKFSDFGYPTRGGMHVERDRFDHLLLQHSAECGASVFEQVIVRNVDFSATSPRVEYDDRRGGASAAGAIHCRFVIDASGPSAVLARQFGSRQMVGTDGKFLGLWGYYQNADYLGVDRQRHTPAEVYQVKPVTFVLSYEDGWIWHIILRESTSVGLVMNTGRVKGMGKKAQEHYFRETCASVPYLRELLAPATFIEDSMFFRPDYSYYNERIVGENFFCIGDAAAFVDPIFSQGVLTSFYHASLCSWTITAMLQDPRRANFYRQLFSDRVFQYYGFSRLLTFGDFGGEGIDPALVKAIVKSLPRNELELSLSASMTTNRHANLQRMALEAGLIRDMGDEFVPAKVSFLDELVL